MTIYRVTYPEGEGAASQDVEADQEPYVDAAEGGLVFKRGGVIVAAFGQWMGVEVLTP